MAFPLAPGGYVSVAVDLMMILLRALSRHAKGGSGSPGCMTAIGDRLCVFSAWLADFDRACPHCSRFFRRQPDCGGGRDGHRSGVASACSHR